MGDASKVSRKFSERTIMEAIIQGGPISRASISKQTGLSKQTVSEIVRQLEQEGWVQETGRSSGHIGRTAVNYELVPNAAFLAAVDLGGTKLRVAILDLSCQVLAEEVEATDPQGGNAVVEQIVALCWRIADRTGIARDRIRLAVVGVPGAPDNNTGRVLMAPNLAGFDRMDVAGALEQALGINVVLENDVNLAVIGENWQGVGQNIDNLAYIAVGTGLGCGLLVDGKPVRGATNAAGELGFLPFGADPFEPESQRSGALERVAASIGIIERYAHLSGLQASVPVIFERANAGDEHAGQVLDETAKYLARGVVAVVAIANPQKVILGGSIGLREELLDRVKLFLPALFPRAIEIERSPLGARAALIGAAAIGLEHLHNTLFGTEMLGGRISLPPADGLELKVAAT
jgi:predicted NBD/HSP70 family sugar kinase/biotin operon repressor